MNNETYVTKTAEGGWRVVGARVSLDSVIHAYWEGKQPEAIVADFPSLTLEQVYGTIAFYLRRRDEIDKYLLEQDARWREFQEESTARHDPLLQRIRTSGQSPVRP